MIRSPTWYTVVQAQDGTPYGFLAVSESMDPTQGWKGVQLPMKPANLGMKLGFDKNGIYITFIVMTGDTHTMHGCFAIPKDDAIAADGPAWPTCNRLPIWKSNPSPRRISTRTSPADAPELILNREFGNSFSKMYLYKLTWSGKTATLSKAQIIPLEPDLPIAERLVPAGPGGSTRSGRQTTGRRGPPHDVRLRTWRQHLLLQCRQEHPRLPLRSVLVRDPGERRRAAAGRFRGRARTATTWCPRSPSMQTAISAWAAPGLRKRSFLRSAS